MLHSTISHVSLQTMEDHWLAQAHDTQANIDGRQLGLVCRRLEKHVKNDHSNSCVCAASAQGGQ